MSAGGRRSGLIPFEAASGFLMLLIVAAMAFLACFALAGSLGTSRVANSWTDGLAGAATVRISAGEQDRARRESLALDILRATPGVIDARVLSQADVAELLTPWFGSAPQMGELPTPSIITIKLDPELEPDPEIVQARLDGASSGAVYDDHGRWRNRAASAARAVGGLTVWALGFAVLAIAAVVYLVVSIAMAAHKNTISALRLAGAEDRFVAGVYQKRFFWLGLLGGLLGAVLALVAFFGMDALSSITSALPGIEPPYYWPFVMGAVVLSSGLIALLSARVAVLTTLRRRA